MMLTLDHIRDIRRAFSNCSAAVLAVVFPFAGASAMAATSGAADGSTSQRERPAQDTDHAFAVVGSEGGIAGEVPGACGSVTLTQSFSFAAGPGIACTGAGGSSLNGFARSFPIGPDAPLVVNCVDFGVADNTVADFTVTVNIFTGSVTGPYGSLALLGSLPVTVPVGSAGAIIKADFAAAGVPVVVPAGSTMVVEILAPSRLIADGGDGGAFAVGANTAGQSAPSYIRAPACGMPNFTDTALIGFPTNHMVMRVDAGPLHWTVIEVLNNSGQDAADLHMTFAGTGGTVIVPPGLVVAPGCPTPAVPSNTQVTNTVVIDWGTACVPAGRRVLFVLGTPFGPVSYVNGFWTDENGVNIGDIAPSRVDIDPVFVGGGFVPPNKPFWVIKRQVRYRGDAVYSPWEKPPGECWQRWCCWDVGRLICYDRVLLCRFPDRRTRFLELLGPGAGNCILLRGWREFMRNDEVVWILQMQTMPPVDQGPANPPGGPKPQKPLHFGLGAPDFGGDALELSQSDDGGMTSYPSADFASAFFNLVHALGIPTKNPLLPPIIGFPNLAQAMSPRYHAAAEALAPLEIELQQLSLQGVHPLMGPLADQVAGLRANFHLIANGLAMGVPSDASPYFNSALGLQQIGNLLVGVSEGSPRFVSAAGYLQAMAVGMQVSGQMVLTGLPTVVEQDAFIWAQIARFRWIAESFAASTLPHVRIRLNLGLDSWGPESGQIQVHVKRTGDPDSVPALIDEILPINEFGDVILPGLELETTSAHSGDLVVWVKAPTHLAVIHSVPNLDAWTSPPFSMVNGDADGDNCVDFEDIDYILSTQGQGGTFAPIVPSSDVNRNGVVSFPDLMIANDAIGQCGVPYPGLVAPPCPADFNGDRQVDGNDLGTLLGNWGPCPGCAPDFNGDLVVDGNDLGTLLGYWGPCPGP